MSTKYTVRYLAESIHSNKNDKDYYFLRPCLYDGDKLIAKGSPIIWLTKEQYDSYASVQ